MFSDLFLFLDDHMVFAQDQNQVQPLNEKTLIDPKHFLLYGLLVYLDFSTWSLERAWVHVIV